LLALIGGFPGYLAKLALNNENIRSEIYSAVKKEFLQESDDEFRKAIVNKDIKDDIESLIMDTELPNVGLTKLVKVKQELPLFTWESLTHIDKKREKIDDFLGDGKFIEALRDKYYDKVLSLYESAARVDHHEHVAILKTRGRYGDAIDIEGIGMEYNGKPSSCPNSIINHDKKQAIIVLPNPQKTLETYPDIENIEKVKFSFLRCHSSTFPYLTLKIKVQGTRKAKDIQLVGVEVRENFVSRNPLVRVTRIVSEELELPYAKPKNVVSATGKLYIQNAEYD
jgi:hypothetical protein